MKAAKTLKQSIYNAILDGIISNEYKPGQIINEKSLIAKYEYSKSPVREALTALCNENVLVAIPRCGYEVVKLTTENIHDILKFRMVLESGFLKDAKNSITPEIIEELTKLNKLCINTESGDDYWAHWEHNKNFHLKLISVSRNEFAYNQLKKSLDILKRGYAQFYHDKWNSSIISSDMKSHTPLINALKDGDIEKACLYLQADLSDFGY